MTTSTTAGELFTPAVEPEPLPIPHPTTPGHDVARRYGCRCPEWLNGYGYGVRLAPGQIEPGRFVTDPDCRLHGSL